MNIQENAPLSALTTFGLGGAARFLIEAQQVSELLQALTFAKEKNLKTLVLGGGSNLLVGANGFDGLVIKIDIGGIVREGELLVAGAGESWDALVARAVEEGLWGIENLSGIPGTVGAAPVQNIGAYGAEVKDTLAWVEAFDTQSGTLVRLKNSECNFGYRTSRFKQETGRFVIVRAAFQLQKDGTPNASYKDLADAVRLNLTEVRDKVLAIRAGKFPDLQKEGTAGSFFLNPVVSAEKAAELIARYPQLPHFPAEGGIKVSLAWLLDKVLHIKGMSVGGARLFENQPLVVVAAHGSTSEEVRELVQKVSALAKKELGITLEPEVKIIN